jgi:hypothetical protein
VLGMPGAKPGPWQVGSEDAGLARWRSDGREIFFHDGGYLQVAERVGSITDFQFRPPRCLFPNPVRLPDRRRTVGGGMGRHARWAALPGHEPATRRASVDCDRHQLGRGVIEGGRGTTPSEARAVAQMTTYVPWSQPVLEGEHQSWPITIRPRFRWSGESCDGVTAAAHQFAAAVRTCPRRNGSRPPSHRLDGKCRYPARLRISHWPESSLTHLCACR